MTAMAQEQPEQGLPARILTKADQRVRTVILYNRRPGTSQVRYQEKGREGIGTISLDEIEEIRFDLTRLNPRALSQLYSLGRYDDVIQTMAGKIIPYFNFVDQNANSNEVIKIFIKALYRSGSPRSLLAAVERIEQFAATGEMRRFADIYRSLSLIQQGDFDALAPYKDLFERVSYDDPHAPELWYGNAKMALAKDDWKTANTYLAKIITEAPMQFDWTGEALYLNATYHLSKTNLVVANQICQEIQIVVPMTEWQDKGATLEKEVQALAEELDMKLYKFGGVRERDSREGDQAEIDYRERQRKLKQEEAERLRQEIEEAADQEEDI
jgi:hypothetical protein